MLRNRILFAVAVFSEERISAFFILSAVEKSVVLSDASLLQSNSVKRFAPLICLGLLVCHRPVQRAEAFGTESNLRRAGTFAIGGIGAAGTISEGERALRDLLKQSDAVTRLEGMLPQSTSAGQLYGLLGLRMRDRETYRRALSKYGQRDVRVETMRGCSIGHEPFNSLVREIDLGAYDSSLSRAWPERGQ